MPKKHSPMTATAIIAWDVGQAIQAIPLLVQVSVILVGTLPGLPLARLLFVFGRPAD